MSLVALVHIGSSSVSGGLISEKKLVFTAERECRFQAKLDPKIFLDTISDALKLVLNDLLVAKLGSPTKVVVFLSSPFVAGQLNVLRQRAPKSFKVTEKLVSNLVSAETAKYKDDKQHQVVDSKIMRFFLNGYSVATPHGQFVNNLEVEHYLSIGASDVLHRFREVIIGALHHDRSEFHSAVFATFVVARDLRPADQSFILLDIGGEITELTMVWQGIIRETFSFPIGHHALLRDAVASGETPASARSALTLEVVKDKTLERVKADWLKYFSDGLKQVLQHRFWSGEIILLAEDSSLAPTFSGWLTGAALDNIVFSVKKLALETLSVELLGKLVALGPQAKPTTPLLIETVFMLK